MATKFGFNQADKPTPHRISLLCDFIASFLGIISAFLMSAEFIPYGVSDIVSPIITALLIPVTLLVKRMFGEEVSPGTKVPVEEVSEIKND